LKKKQLKNTGKQSTSTFAIATLGCKVNQYESDAIAQFLEENGCFRRHGDENADVCVINTCAVTQKATMQSRQAIRQAIRNNPGARIIVTGCYAQTDPEKLIKITGIHDIVGHIDKPRIPAMIISPNESDPSDYAGPRDRGRPALSCREISRERDFQKTPFAVLGNRTRPFLKIQDGCDTLCSYCIVPYARGRSRSMDLEAILEHIQKIHQAGCHEVVLTGIHLGAWGLDLAPPSNFSTLLNRIQKESSIARVRLSSIEPLELTPDIIELVAESDRFCHHFHIPLQSGDDGILKKMKRGSCF